MEKLTKQEEEIMLHIWRLGSCTTKEVLQATLHNSGFGNEQPEAQRLYKIETATRGLSFYTEDSAS